MIILAQVKNEIMLQQLMSTWKNFVRNKKNYTINHRRIEKKSSFAKACFDFVILVNHIEVCPARI